MLEDPKKPGPEPERLKIDEDWESAVHKALKKDRPQEGGPDREPEKNGQPPEKPNDNE